MSLREGTNVPGRSESVAEPGKASVPREKLARGEKSRDFQKIASRLATIARRLIGINLRSSAIASSLSRLGLELLVMTSTGRDEVVEVEGRAAVSDRDQMVDFELAIAAAVSCEDAGVVVATSCERACSLPACVRKRGVLRIARTACAVACAGWPALRAAVDAGCSLPDVSSRTGAVDGWHGRDLKRPGLESLGDSLEPGACSRPHHARVFVTASRLRVEAPAFRVGPPASAAAGPSRCPS
jgi:hypothetical protein